MIQNELRNPARNRDSLHSALLGVIAQSLTTRAAAGHRTSFSKVKSHAGIWGNEQADMLANEARDPSNFSLSCGFVAVVQEGRYWPSLIVSDALGTSGAHKAAGNLCAAIKAYVSPNISKGFANDSQ